MEAAQLIADLRACLAAGVFVDPPLAHAAFRSRREAWDTVRELAAAMYERYIHIEMLSGTLGTFPFSPRLMRYALQEALLSTALYIAYQDAGSVHAREEHIQQGAARLYRFIAQRGVDALYRIYCLVMGHDFLQPLMVYKGLTESDLLTGLRHHPIPADKLDHMLLVALSLGLVRLKPRGSQRVVQPTKLGAAQFRWIQAIQAESGYSSLRTALSMVHQFDDIHDWNDVCHSIFPECAQECGEFVDWLDIPAGSHVLEVACGSGTLTLSGRLREALAHHGQLVSVDVAATLPQVEGHPLHQSGRREAQQAPVHRLPYADGVFDVSLTSVFLTRIDTRAVLAEMFRTVVPGGVVALLHALRFDYWRPFIRDWFEPVFRLGRVRSSARSGSSQPAATDEVLQWFADVGLHQVEVRETVIRWSFCDPEIVIEYLVRGVRWFQRTLMSLPWDDRRSLVAELIERGRDVCRHYAPAERVLSIPVVMVKGRRPCQR